MDSKIKFSNLSSLHAPLLSEFNEAFRAILQTSSFVRGEYVKSFERDFAQWVGLGGVTCSCGNGTDALTIAGLSLDLPKGTTALIPAMTFIASAAGLIHAGLSIDFVDICSKTYTMDLDCLENRLKVGDVGLIVPVHLYGQMAPMDKIRKLADQYHCKVIEDAAQAHGATWKGQPIGYWSDAACFSFYPGKNLGALGDGGAIYSKNASYIRSCSILCDQGQEKKYEHVKLGFNSRLDALQASFLSIKLKHLNDWNEKRRAIARAYGDLLEGIPEVVIPKEASEGKHVYHLYVIQVPDRDTFAKFMSQRGIETGIHYPKAVHQHLAMKPYLKSVASFPEAEKLARHGISLPMDPNLQLEEVTYVCKAIREFFKAPA